jgi:hypothetical protein
LIEPKSLFFELRAEPFKRTVRPAVRTDGGGFWSEATAEKPTYFAELCRCDLTRQRRFADHTGDFRATTAHPPQFKSDARPACRCLRNERYGSEYLWEDFVCQLPNKFLHPNIRQKKMAHCRNVLGKSLFFTNGSAMFEQTLNLPRIIRHGLSLPLTIVLASRVLNRFADEQELPGRTERENRVGNPRCILVPHR